MKFKNAETQEISRRLNQSDCKDKSERLGRLQSSSEINGAQSLRSDKTNSSGENLFRGITKPREISVGKILKRLELVEDAFVSYIKTHQENLRASLDNSKKEEESFLEIIAQLKQEVHDFVSSDNSSSKSD